MTSPAILLALVSLQALPTQAAAPITLSRVEVPAGWFLYRLHEGSLEEMGSEFARFAILRGALGGEGTLAAVFLSGPLEGGAWEAEVGLVLDSPPRKVPGGCMLRRIESCDAAVGEGSGNWGDGPGRLREVRAWAAALGLEEAGPPRVLFLGDPQEPSSLVWRVILPVRAPEPPPSAGETEPVDEEPRR